MIVPFNRQFIFTYQIVIASHNPQLIAASNRYVASLAHFRPLATHDHIESRLLNNTLFRQGAKANIYCEIASHTKF